MRRGQDILVMINGVQMFGFLVKIGGVGQAIDAIYMDPNAAAGAVAFTKINGIPQDQSDTPADNTWNFVQD